MPRYFFHTRDGRDGTDNEGVELLDDEQARTEATRASGEMLACRGDHGWNTSPWTMQVAHEHGHIVCELTVLAKRS